jgi:hypothetical protein
MHGVPADLVSLDDHPFFVALMECSDLPSSDALLKLLHYNHVHRDENSLRILNSMGTVALLRGAEEEAGLIPPLVLMLESVARGELL